MASEWDRLFDELYLRTYAPLQPAEAAEVMALAAARLAGCEAGADVLDCPCGFGRHSEPLAEAGYRVVGADRSPVLLGEARRRSEGGEWPQWVQADYRDLPFADRSFDAVLNLFTSLGYHGEEGDRRALAEFRRVLRADGRLVVETMHRDRLVTIFQPRGWDRVPEGVLLEEREFDPVRGAVRTLHALYPDGGEPVSARYEARVYTATELARLVGEAGFVDVECHGDLDGAPLTPETRLVVVARAPSR